ncbi:hypothetical protein JCM6882_008748 [Rhodosporidiobolus microsporus]
MLRTSLSLAALLTAGGSVDASPVAPRAAASVVTSYTTSLNSTWTNKGCYSDLLYGSRALPNLLIYGQKQTVDACIETCEAKGYKLCGVEHHGQCWGGNSLADWSASLGSAACEFTCADNTSQLCGGTGGVERASFQLYAIGNTTVGPTTTTTTTTAAPTATPTGPVAVESYTNDNSTLWTRSGCYSDLMYGERALPNLLAFGQKNTVGACLDTCQKKGYELCGVEYHGECWGANSQASWSTKQDDSACELECWDNTKQLCGGSGGPTRATFQLYKKGQVPVPTLTITTTTTPPPSTTTTTTTTTTTSTTTTQAPAPTVWKLQSCISGSGIGQSNAQYTIPVDPQTGSAWGLWSQERCLAQCASTPGVVACGITGATSINMGYSDNTRCYVFTNKATGAPAHFTDISTLAPERCNAPCAGNPSQTTGCGGVGALSLWLPNETVAFS